MSEWTLECLILAEACVVFNIREQLDEVSPTQKYSRFKLHIRARKMVKSIAPHR